MSVLLGAHLIWLSLRVFVVSQLPLSGLHFITYSSAIFVLSVSHLVRGTDSNHDGPGTKTYRLISFRRSPRKTEPQTRHTRLDYSFVNPNFFRGQLSVNKELASSRCLPCLSKEPEHRDGLTENCASYVFEAELLVN